MVEEELNRSGHLFGLERGCAFEAKQMLRAVLTGGPQGQEDIAALASAMKPERSNRVRADGATG